MIIIFMFEAFGECKIRRMNLENGIKNLFSLIHLFVMVIIEMQK